MIKVLFVCHGNICRSPMAEFILKKLVKEKGLEKDFYIDSRATSSEEIGNPVYYLAKEKLLEHDISSEEKVSQKLKSDDYDKFDYIIGMDTENIQAMKRILRSEKKIYKLLDFTTNKKDIEDPWYTRDFDTTYTEIVEGCQSFLSYVLNKE